tara:strand:+ start:1551 stop:2987 length:1437 start_codon:yes stop_codon:yes gene_type:complete
MFDSTRSIFPAYSGIGEVRVQWPQPPRASSVNRNLKTLWNIHQDNPHVDANQGPGFAVPLPTDGYDPNGFSEDSRVLEFANRGSTPITPEIRTAIGELLQKTFSRVYEVEQADVHSSVFELKDAAREENPGVFCLYNGSSRVQLIKAISLVRALEEAATDWSTEARFSLDAKEEFVEYIKVCPPALAAVIQSKSTLQQNALRNTEAIDHVDECLSLLGISVDSRANPEDIGDEFEGSALKLKMLTAQRELMERDRLLRGDLSRCFHSVCGQLAPMLNSKACVEIAGATLSECRDVLKRRQLRCLDKLENLYGLIAQQMQAAGVNPDQASGLQREIVSVRQLRDAVNSLAPLKFDTTNCPQTRGVYDKERSIQTLQGVIQQLQPANAGLACEISLLLCACDAIAASTASNDNRMLASRLADSLEAIPPQDPTAQTKKLDAEMASEKSHIRSVRQQKAFESLEKAPLTADKKSLIARFLR